MQIKGVAIALAFGLSLGTAARGSSRDISSTLAPSGKGADRSLTVPLTTAETVRLARLGLMAAARSPAVLLGSSARFAPSGRRTSIISRSFGSIQAEPGHIRTRPKDCSVQGAGASAKARAGDRVFPAPQ